MWKNQIIPYIVPCLSSAFDI